MKVLRIKREKPDDYPMCASDGSMAQPPLGCCDNPFNNNDFEGSNLSAADLLASSASALFCDGIKVNTSDSEELLPPCKYSEAAAELQRASSCLQKVSPSLNYF